jgi:hypothetical protein
MNAPNCLLSDFETVLRPAAAAGKNTLYGWLCVPAAVTL